MAAEDEGRTEEPSEYKLEKARKEGRVAKSAEISSSLILIFVILLLLFMGKWIFTQCVNIFIFYFNRCAKPDFSNNNIVVAFYNIFLRVLIPISLVSIFFSMFPILFET